jgi:triphosphoribosyl-dephospho-CoA synthase
VTDARTDGRERPVAADAELALLLEVATTPTPGNVDRERDLPDLHFEQFLGGAVGARPGLAAAADGAPVGEAFERAVAGMADRSDTNTQFGALLALVPLVRAAADGAATGERATYVVRATTVDDAVAFYRAFDHVAVGVDDPPAGSEVPDVRLGGDAEPRVREAGLTFADVMAESAPTDAVAAELVGGYERTVRVANRVVADEGPLTDRAATAFLAQLAAEPDTHVAKRHDEATAERVRERAAALRAEGAPADEVRAFAADLVDDGVNPGATADILAAGLFVALWRGAEL